MRKSIKLGAALMAAGVGTAVAAASVAEHGVPELTVAAGLLSGACTSLGVTSVLVGWADHRPAQDTER